MSGRGRRTSPRTITELADGEVFVFGSNGAGAHAGGAARAAYERFGAVWGRGHGYQGRSYAIDTMSGWDVLTADVRDFLDFARGHDELTFLLTPVGTGIAGWDAARVAPLFADAPGNVLLPESFADALDAGRRG